jgi:hypothetical protein
MGEGRHMTARTREIDVSKRQKSLNTPKSMCRLASRLESGAVVEEREDKGYVRSCRVEYRRCGDDDEPDILSLPVKSTEQDGDVSAGTNVQAVKSQNIQRSNDNKESSND